MQHLMLRLQQHGQELAGADLAPIGAVLGQVAPIDYADFIPEDSVLHEFIG